jgi:hypothetical protein
VQGANVWLKNYVFFRIDPPAFITRVAPKSFVANMTTKFTSAVWHGFYPGTRLHLAAAPVMRPTHAGRASVLPVLPQRRPGQRG